MFQLLDDVSQHVTKSEKFLDSIFSQSVNTINYTNEILCSKLSCNSFKTRLP